MDWTVIAVAAIGALAVIVSAWLNSGKLAEIKKVAVATHEAANSGLTAVRIELAAARAENAALQVAVNSLQKDAVTVATTQQALDDRRP